MGVRKRLSYHKDLKCKLAKSLDNILSAVNDLITTTFNDIQLDEVTQPQPQLVFKQLSGKGRPIMDQITWWAITSYAKVEKARFHLDSEEYKWAN